MNNGDHRVNRATVHRQLVCVIANAGLNRQAQ